MQSRWSSFVEQLLNVGSGYVLSLLVWSYFVVPVWNLEVSTKENLVITGVFTVVSVIRGYCWRRWFNSRLKGDK